MFVENCLDLAVYGCLAWLEYFFFVSTVLSWNSGCLETTFRCYFRVEQMDWNQFQYEPDYHARDKNNS